MLKNHWQYKSDEGKCADVSLVMKIASQNCSDIWKKEIGDRHNVPLLRKPLREMLAKLCSRGIEFNKLWAKNFISVRSEEVV